MTPQPVCAVHACGASTGLVVDVGLLETTCIPVVDGSPLYHCMGSTRRASAAIEAQLVDQLQQPLSNKAAEDIKVCGHRLHYIKPSTRMPL